MDGSHLIASPAEPPVDDDRDSQDVERLDVAQLGSMLREHRGQLSLRQAAEASGVSFSTFSRVESGSQPDLTSFTLLCAWLGVSPGQFFTPVNPRETEPLEKAIAHLQADPRLERDAANKIANVLKDLYDALASVQSPKPVAACHLRAAAVMRPGVPARLSALLSDMHDKLATEVAAGRL